MKKIEEKEKKFESEKENLFTDLEKKREKILERPSILPRTQTKSRFGTKITYLYPAQPSNVLKLSNSPARRKHPPGPFFPKS